MTAAYVRRRLRCPWEAATPHDVRWVGASFGPGPPGFVRYGTTREYFRCETCPRVLLLEAGVIESTPGRVVRVKLDGRTRTR